MNSRTKILAAAGGVLLTLGAIAPAYADDAVPATKNVGWVLAAGSTTAAPFAGGPQSLYTGQCGTGIIQADVYRYATDQQKQLVDSLVTAGVLDNYADSSVFLSVTWSKQTPCAAPTPTEQPTPAPAPAPVQAATAPAPVVARIAAPAAPVPTTARFTG